VLSKCVLRGFVYLSDMVVRLLQIQVYCWKSRPNLTAGNLHNIIFPCISLDIHRIEKYLKYESCILKIFRFYASVSQISGTADPRPQNYLTHFD
jgi:hypothetical protein